MRFVADDIFCASKTKHVSNEDEDVQDFQAALENRQFDSAKADDAATEVSDDGDEAEAGCLEVALKFRAATRNDHEMTFKQDKYISHVSIFSLYAPAALPLLQSKKMCCFYAGTACQPRARSPPEAPLFRRRRHGPYHFSKNTPMNCN